MIYEKIYFSFCWSIGGVDYVISDSHFLKEKNSLSSSVSVTNDWNKENEINQKRFLQDLIKIKIDNIPLSNIIIDYDRSLPVKKTQEVITIKENIKKEDIFLDMEKYIEIISEKIGKNNISYQAKNDLINPKIEISTTKEKFSEIQLNYKYFLIECLNDEFIKINFIIKDGYHESISEFNKGYLHNKKIEKNDKTKIPLKVEDLHHVNSLEGFSFENYSSVDELQSNLRIVEFYNMDYDTEKRYVFLLERISYNIYYYILFPNKINYRPEASSQLFLAHNSIDEDDDSKRREFWGSHKHCNYIGFGDCISDLLFYHDKIKSDLNDDNLREIYKEIIEKPFKLFKENENNE